MLLILQLRGSVMVRPHSGN